MRMVKTVPPTKTSLDMNRFPEQLGASIPDGMLTTKPIETALRYHYAPKKKPEPVTPAASAIGGMITEEMKTRLRALRPNEIARSVPAPIVIKPMDSIKVQILTGGVVVPPKAQGMSRPLHWDAIAGLNPIYVQRKRYGKAQGQGETSAGAAREARPGTIR